MLVTIILMQKNFIAGLWPFKSSWNKLRKVGRPCIAILGRANEAIMVSDAFTRVTTLSHVALTVSMTAM